MSFTEELSKYLAESLGVDEKVIEAALNQIKISTTVEFESQKKPEFKPKKQSKEPEPDSELKKQGQRSKDHKCQRIKRGGELCNKKPTRLLLKPDGTERWLCGTQKSGCYKVEFGNMNKKVVKTSTTKAPTTKSERKEVADSRSRILANKIITSKDVHVSKFKTKAGDVVRMEKETRILFRVDTAKAYGVLDKDDKTIQLLTSKEVQWLEAHGFKFEEDKVSIKPTTSKHEESSSESTFGSSSNSEESLEHSSSGSILESSESD